MEKVIILLEVKVVDKQEFRLKTEQMFEYMKKKSYKEALDIAESMEWKKVKNVAVLNAVSEVYEANEEYQKSRDILFLAYDRAPESKKIIYRLGTLALKMGEIQEAMDCYEEFMTLAPKDPNGFIFKYKILKAKNAPLEEQIAVLEDFKKVEYVEKWAFELAGLYREAGMITECLEECDDLIIWFSEGKYIYKAMELKMQYKPLTPLQHEKYMNRSSEKPVEETQVQESEAEVPQQEVAEVTAEVSEEPTQAEELTLDEVVEQQEETPAEDKPTLSIEEIVQNFQAEQKENAQMIQAELERVEQEKAQNEDEVEESEEEKEEILSDDVRRLMEELEAESAEIQAQKTTQEEEAVIPEESEASEEAKEEEKPLLQKVVEQLAALDVNIPIPGKQAEVEPIEEIEEEDEGIKLGDTQSMALAAKALASAATMEIPQIDAVAEPVVPVAPVAPVTPVTSVASPVVSEMAKEEKTYDTGFVVQGRYDLEAQSEIGLKAGLTEEQKKLFSYFVPVHGMSEQIVKVLQDDKECKTRYGTSRIGNIVLVGRKGSGKTVLAVDIVKAIQSSRRMKQGKVAIVKADALNKKDVSEIAEKLHGGALVIENASRLKRKSIEELCEVMEGQTGELLVLLEDERKPMDKMLNEYPNFKKKFTSRIELPVFINDELVTFAQTYAKENGYKIDEMGILALYSEIDILQREDRIVTVTDVKNIIDDAIDKANAPSLKKIFKKMIGQGKDDADRIILKEEDFK